MLDIASVVLGGFQDDLSSTFGDSIGWAVGHAILLIFLGVLFFGIRGRDHIINHSGVGRSEALDLGVFLLLTLSLYYINSSMFDFELGASLGLAAAASLFLRWMVTVLG